jgi:hypothetical protein
LKNRYGLSNKARPKPVAEVQDAEEMIYYLWAEDEHFFNDERTRIQLVLYFLILAFTAARPGAVIVSDCYRNSNECMTYRVRDNAKHSKEFC